MELVNTIHRVLDLIVAGGVVLTTLHYSVVYAWRKISARIRSNRQAS